MIWRPPLPRNPQRPNLPPLIPLNLPLNQKLLLPPALLPNRPHPLAMTLIFQTWLVQPFYPVKRCRLMDIAPLAEEKEEEEGPIGPR